MSSKKGRIERGARSRELRRQYAPTDDSAALWSELSKGIDLSIEDNQNLRAKYNQLVKDFRTLARDHQRLVNHVNYYRKQVGDLHKDASEHKAGMITGVWAERFEPWSL